jgi:hypothetical protein
MIDLNAIRARYLRICAMESAPSAQSTGAAIAYSLDVPPLLAAIDRVYAMHHPYRPGTSRGDRDCCRACFQDYPCETIKALEQA